MRYLMTSAVSAHRTVTASAMMSTHWSMHMRSAKMVHRRAVSSVHSMTQQRSTDRNTGYRCGSFCCIGVALILICIGIRIILCVGAVNSSSAVWAKVCAVVKLCSAILTISHLINPFCYFICVSVLNYCFAGSVILLFAFFLLVTKPSMATARAASASTIISFMVSASALAPISAVPSSSVCFCIFSPRSASKENSYISQSAPIASAKQKANTETKKGLRFTRTFWALFKSSTNIKPSAQSIATENACKIVYQNGIT